ncbi:hypothetical protein HNQ53_003406 [Microbulbifer hydrolyticus]|uniref:Uncharacterized protein n=1 Tax=Microbulbifer hydrolyticus TaxID=48074 RepID=A0AA89T622_9GAMM|nr:hypothetical protein [Microbulbifer hydrolyticus]
MRNGRNWFSPAAVCIRASGLATNRGNLDIGVIGKCGVHSTAWSYPGKLAAIFSRRGLFATVWGVLVAFSNIWQAHRIIKARIK